MNGWGFGIGSGWLPPEKNRLTELVSTGSKPFES